MSENETQNKQNCNEMNGQKRAEHRRQPLIRNSSLWVNSGESDPMANRFRIDSTDFLDAMSERDVCPKCLKSRKYYCYTCYIPLDTIRSRLPSIRLPVKVDIIKHIQEVDGKSTCAHAAIIAPEDCTVYCYPDIPDWTDHRVILVFPGPYAQTLNQLIDSYFTNCDTKPTNSELPFDRVVFIDSTWRQTKKILSDPRVSPLANRTVQLSTHDSLFWRHQRHTPRTYLSTIEAIYYFFDDLNKILIEKRVNSSSSSDANNCDQLSEDKSDHRYDNLLFFFKHTYNKLRQKYNI